MLKNRIARRQFIRRAAAASGALLGGSPQSAQSAPLTLEALKSGWQRPPRSYRPHTRWWWPGNAVTQEGITWQLEQMKAQGMGGVEIMSAWGWYSKGNLAYLSPEWTEMVRHALNEAARLDLDAALTFGPGWSFGGFWVPPEQRSKVLAAGWRDLTGPGVFEDALPRYEGKRPAGEEEPEWRASDEDKIVAVAAGRWDGRRLDGDSLVDLTPQVAGDGLKWTVPAGQWRLMAFRLKYTGQQNQAQNSLPHNWVVDHLNQTAMEAYCTYLARAFEKAFGAHLGSTVDSFFCDSFEIHPLPDTLLWSSDALERFRGDKGYDLARYLPAVWFDIGELTPRIRYDVNEFLHRLGLETAYRTFVETAARCHVQARIQPHYRFPTEIIRGAGATPRPETEVTTARFETVADPRKATAAGAHFYGRQILSAEAYTFIHPERYRTSLEEMKRATDAFLRDGVTQFYNHGYVYSPEKEVAPSRDVPWANRISHWATWWRYYHHLAAYVARASYLLRQGSLVADVLLYSPQATAWAERALFNRERRVMPYGNVPKTLLANGYDYEPVNDDVLVNHARFEAGQVRVRDSSYRFLILPKIVALPVETLEAMERFVRSGGVLIALEALPGASVGLKDYRQRDERVREVVSTLFGPAGKGRDFSGGGRTCFLPEYKIEEPVFSPMEQPCQPTPPLTAPQSALLDILRARLAPDFALEGNRQSDGLTFQHRRVGELDVYFVTNLQPAASRTTMRFRVRGKGPESWDAMTGEIAPVHNYRSLEGVIEIPVELEPWESGFYVFRPGAAAPRSAGVKPAETLPPLEITGPWKLTLEGVRYPRREMQLARLASWSEEAETRYFSGTGSYELEFDVPAQYARDGLEQTLDLGAVGHVAEVFLNGQQAGVRWMQPYRLPLKTRLRAGRNRLRVDVTNLLINHVAGLKKLPEVPAQLAPHYGTTADNYPGGANAFKRDARFRPLPESGLMGPVRLLARRK